MELAVRPLKPDEFGLVIDYFHGAGAEHLEMLGVDPTRLPERARWAQLFEQDFALPIEQRNRYFVLWTAGARPLGFSSVDRIQYGVQAFMHLHVVDPAQRRSGYGAECVRRSTAIYFDALNLQRLYCEPNAFNVAPNRTLQKAGFRYLKTHMTVPGPLNFHQAVTRWVLEKA